MRLADRVAAVRQRLADECMSALLVNQPTNVAYMTGFEGVFDGEAAHAAVITPETQSLYTDGRYAEAMRRAAEGTGWEILVPEENMYSVLCADLAAIQAESLAIEESVPHGRFRFLSQQFEGRVEAVDHWVEDLRQVKEPEEISRIEAAQQLTDAGFAFIAGVIKTGMSELEVALELEFYLRKNGSDGVAFPVIVASGPNSALPHARVTDRRIETGDWVLIDFGARVDGYCADMTRTVVMGYATEMQRSVYEAVRGAGETGVAAARAGVPGKDVDAAARAYLASHDLAEKFTHSLGHGVGMEVHELPVIGKRGSKSLREGNVITVEPGVYEPGVGGVRIENLVVLEAGGSRVLTTSTTELVEV
jgi:Xaa-Pro aminopeptidase